MTTTTESNPLRAFHGDPATKEKYLARVRQHRAADELVSGTGWENGRGCAIGCTLEAYDHRRYPIELGIPLQLAYLEDRLFERLARECPREEHLVWPERFLSAITPGADLSGVWPRFVVWLLVDPTHGVLQYAKDEQVRATIQRVADLYANGPIPSESTPETRAALARARELRTEAWSRYWSAVSRYDRAAAEAEAAAAEAAEAEAAAAEAAAAAAEAAAASRLAQLLADAPVPA